MDINLKQLFVNIVANTNDSYSFENYDELERGVKLPDNSKIIIEFQNRKYYISFNSIQKEISKSDFYELKDKWEVGKRNALSLELSKRQEKDLIKLREISNKYL